MATILTVTAIFARIWAGKPPQADGLSSDSRCGTKAPVMGRRSGPAIAAAAVLLPRVGPDNSRLPRRVLVVCLPPVLGCASRFWAARRRDQRLRNATAAVNLCPLSEKATAFTSCGWTFGRKGSWAVERCRRRIVSSALPTANRPLRAADGQRPAVSRAGQAADLLRMTAEDTSLFVRRTEGRLRN